MVWIFLLIAGSLEILGVVLLNELSRTQNKLFIILLGLAFIL
ncbi:QacE family quaternary ammonium compound efflux SMR transporter, partial [Staphylococcus aureus]|nr:QacE family quaternary ammonium compound efflux SMR transporter [Staphylococcus aureus]